MRQGPAVAWGLFWMIVLALFLLSLCSPATALTPQQVLVVYSQTYESAALAMHYCEARGVPVASNTLALTWRGSYSCTKAEGTALNTAIRAKADTIHADVIVLCRDLPGIVTGAGSLDSMIASDGKGARMNPYQARTEPFTHAKFGTYIVCRFDGWSWADANALIDRALKAGAQGSWLIDRSPLKETGGYARYGTMMGMAATALGALSKPMRYDTTAAFQTGTGLGGYVSWGSNDPRYVKASYEALRFLPGAIATTGVSTSAMYLRAKPVSGQSQIATLIANGVTGMDGSVAEPMLSGIARPDLLFPAYASGRQLGEAFWASEPYVGWMSIVVGDPLCVAYGR